MKRVLLAVALTFASLLHADEVPRRYIVATRAAAPVAVRRILTDDLSPRAGRDIQTWDLVDAFAATLTDAEVAQLRASAHVAYVEPVFERHLMAFSSRVTANSDAIASGREIIPYGVDMVNGPSVWAVSRGAGKNGAPTHVAIIDTGIDYNHPELRHAYKGGTDLVNNDNDPLDDEGHGTHVAGIIAAAFDGTGVVGVAPDVDLYSVKVLNNCGSTPNTTTDVLITAIQWVVNEKQTIGGNWVVNLSLGGGNFSAAESAAFQAAADAGILTFASSGNGFDPTSPTFTIAYPAAYPSVVAVGAIDSTKTVATFSQRGPELKLVAPGVDVLSSLIASELTTSNGKTFAAELGSASNSNGDPVCLSSQHFTGPFVFCGFGGSAADFPTTVSGKVALISRGNGVTFATKMANAKAAKAIGAVVFNNVGDGLIAMDLGTAASASAVLPMLFIGQSDGQALLASNATVTSGFGLETYANFDGTSMSSPHAAACAALAWSVAPSASRADVLNALLNTAHDLGDPGVDQTYGYGLVDAYAAAVRLAPSLFPPPSLTGRQVIRRH
jgi:subtilisin family serine protease